MASPPVLKLQTVISSVLKTAKIYKKYLTRCLLLQIVLNIIIKQSKRNLLYFKLLIFN